MLEIKIQSDELTPAQIEKYLLIFNLLIEKGALDGVKGGKAILHFDSEAQFMGVELNYWPYRRRKQ